MRSWKLFLAVLALAGPASAQALKPGEMVVWGQGHDEPTHPSYSSGGVTATLSATGGDHSLIAVEIRADDERPARFVIDDIGKLENAMENDVLIGFFDLDPEAQPGQVVLVDYVCGQMCGYVVRLVERRDGAWRMVRIGSSDRGGDFEPPSDLNGDGVLDVRLPDGRFQNTFPIPSELSAPPRLLNVRGGQVRDVSTSPGFRPVFAEVARAAEPVCKGGDETACAIFTAASARAGTFEAAWKVVLAARFGEARAWNVCRHERKVVCRSRDEVWVSSFPEALRWNLGQIEYLPPGPPLRPAH